MNYKGKRMLIIVILYIMKNSVYINIIAIIIITIITKIKCVYLGTASQKLN